VSEEPWTGGLIRTPGRESADFKKVLEGMRQGVKHWTCGQF